MPSGNVATPFVIFTFFLYPISKYLLRKDKDIRKKALYGDEKAQKLLPTSTNKLYKILTCLSFLGLILYLYNFFSAGPNYYKILNVSRDARYIDIKKSYRSMSVILHPDKPTGSNEKFKELNHAYDILSDTKSRLLYDKFGPSAEQTERNKISFDEDKILIDLCILYASMAVFAFVLTMGKESGNCRSYIFTMEIIMIIFEGALLLSNAQEEVLLPTWVLPRMAEFEIINLLHSLFPVYMNICRLYGYYYSIDFDEHILQSLKAISEGNKLSLTLLRDIQVNMGNIHSTSVKQGDLTNDNGNKKESLNQVNNNVHNKNKDNGSNESNITVNAVLKNLGNNSNTDQENNFYSNNGNNIPFPKQSPDQGGESKLNFFLPIAISMAMFYFFSGNDG